MLRKARSNFAEEVYGCELELSKHNKTEHSDLVQTDADCISRTESAARASLRCSDIAAICTDISVSNVFEALSLVSNLSAIQLHCR